MHLFSSILNITTNNNETLFPIENNSTLSPIPCATLNIWSAYFCIVFLVSTSANLFILLSHGIRNDIQRPVNFFIYFLTLFNLAGSSLNLPFLIISHYKCKWVFLIVFFVNYSISCLRVYDHRKRDRPVITSE
jgi:uncharacterized membrane-anchored protein YitT (DUF2179 family)